MKNESDEPEAFGMKKNDELALMMSERRACGID